MFEKLIKRNLIQRLTVVQYIFYLAKLEVEFLRIFEFDNTLFQRIEHAKSMILRMHRNVVKKFRVIDQEIFSSRFKIFLPKQCGFFYRSFSLITHDGTDWSMALRDIVVYRV